MKYIELTIRTTTEASELVADVLWDYTGGGVAISDYADVVALQTGKTGIYWDYLDGSLLTPRTDVLVKGFLELGHEADIPSIMQTVYERRDALKGTLDFGTLEESKRIVESEDWIEVWKKHFRPIRRGYLVVVPEWIEYHAGVHEQTVVLDNNMAFGTGEHETTAMCLDLIQEYLEEGDVVLDVGCGSGILGIAAVKLGAEHCYLTDIDPIAVASAKHNAEKNGVEEKVTVTECDLVGDAQIKADLIVANITENVLCELAPAIPGHLNAGGTVILSGILHGDDPFLRTAFVSRGLRIAEERHEGVWYSLVLKG